MKNFFNIIFLIVMAIGTTSCGKKEKQQLSFDAKPFDVVNVPIKTVVGYQTFPANIEGKMTNSVRAKTSGYIQELYVDEGQMVTKGQSLFKLETNALSQTANAAKAGIISAESNVNAAQVEVNKLIPLVEKNIISAVQLETAKANLSKAKSQLEVAKADFQSIAANIDYSTIKSPIAGVVGALPFKVGSLVGPSDPSPLTEVSDNSEVYAYFAMNEKEYFNFLEKTKGEGIKEKLNNLPEVRLELANNQIYSEKGKIDAITGQINPNTGTVRFRAVFNNKKGLLTNGNSGKVLLPRVYKDVLVVPEISTFEQQGIVYVYAVEDDVAKINPVNVVDRIGSMAIIDSGLNEKDLIIASGVGSIRSGATIVPKHVKFDSIINSIKPIF